MTPVTINLDLSKRPDRRSIVRVRQGEFSSTTLEARIYDWDAAVDLAPYDVYLEMVHPNGKCASVRCEADGNTATLVFDGRTAAMPGTVELAYIALKQHADDGTQTLCATTQAFAVEVLPDAASEGCGIAEAYSSEIVEMLLKCRAEFDADQADRADRFKAAMDDWGKKAIDAADRANEAADKVDEALSGNLDPLFKAYLDALKDVEGGFPSWETYLDGIEKAGKPDNKTLGKNEANEMFVMDGGIDYGKLAGIPFPFLPNVWELEDLTIRCGTLVNAGAGWNTFKFPEPFEAVPVVMARAYSNRSLRVQTVTKESFQYMVLTSGGSTTADTAEVYWIAIEDGRTA